MSPFDDPRSPLGPRARAALDRMECVPSPRTRCDHLRDDLTASKRFLCSWLDRIVCPECVQQTSHDRRRAAARRNREQTCGGCGNGVLFWEHATRDLGALVLLVPMCHGCLRDDERDALAEADYIPATATPNGS